MARLKFAVIGLGHFGSNICLDLAAEGAEVVAIDCDEEKVEVMRDKVSYPVCLDSTEVKSLQALGVQDMDAVIVAIGEDFESSILTIAHLQELGVQRVIGRVISPTHERLLRLMKVDELVLPEKEAAHRLTKSLTSLGLVGATQISPEYSIVEMEAPKGIVGRAIGEVNLRQEFQLNLVTIKRQVKKRPLLTQKEVERIEVLGVPDKDYVFTPKDILVIFGHEKYIRRFMSQLNEV